MNGRAATDTVSDSDRPASVETGERYPDVIVFWVASEADEEALVEDESTPFFTTPHFAGHRSVLLRASRVGELTRAELAEVVRDAWLSRASAGEPRPRSALPVAAAMLMTSAGAAPTRCPGRPGPEPGRRRASDGHAYLSVRGEP